MNAKVDDLSVDSCLNLPGGSISGDALELWASVGVVYVVFEENSSLFGGLLVKYMDILKVLVLVILSKFFDLI